MKRILTSILAIYSLSVGAGLPPSTISGERDSTNTVKFNLKAPNYQSTNLGGLDSRIETGNTNLLVNPSFEHTTVTTGWTISNATSSADTTNQVEGKKALSLSLTGALALTQDSTINAANLTGLQGVAQVKLKSSDVTDLKVCVRNAGTTSSTLCVNVTADGTWKHIQIPFIMSTTSNGIAITSTSDTSGTVIVDDAYVGTSSPFLGVNGAKLVGTLKYAATTSCTWAVTATTWTDPTANASCSSPTTSGAVSAPSTKVPRIIINNAQAGDYYFVANGMFWKQNGGQGGFRFSDGTLSSTINSIGASGSISTQMGVITGKVTRTTQTTNWDIGVQITSNGSITQIENDTAGNFEDFEIQVYYFPPESKIYSQASQDYDWTSFTPTSPNSSITFTSPNCYKKREGSDLLIRCNAIIGAGGSSGLAAQMALPDSLTTSSTLSTSSLVGMRGIGTNTATSFYIMAQPSVGYITYSNQSSGANSQTLATGATIADAQQQSWYARIPIQGWQDYGTIVGSFAGIEKCANDYECTDTLSAQISTSGVLTNFNTAVAWATCSYSSPTMTCTYISGLKDGTNNLSSPMNCEATTVDTTSTTGNTVNFKSNSSTGFSYGIGQDGVSNTNKPISIKCQKGTNDYKPKTAKVASSVGVPTVPGITTAGTGNLIDTFSVSYGTTNATTVCSASPCSYLDQIGTVVSSVTRSATGTYTLNLSKTYAKLKCSYYCMGGVVCGSGQALSCSNCSTLSFNSYNTNSFTIQDSFGLLHCQGQY